MCSYKECLLPYAIHYVYIAIVDVYLDMSLKDIENFHIEKLPMTRYVEFEKKNQFSDTSENI